MPQPASSTCDSLHATAPNRARPQHRLQERLAATARPIWRCRTRDFGHRIIVLMAVPAIAVGSFTGPVISVALYLVATIALIALSYAVRVPPARCMCAICTTSVLADSSPTAPLVQALDTLARRCGVRVRPLLAPRHRAANRSASRHHESADVIRDQWLVRPVALPPLALLSIEPPPVARVHDICALITHSRRLPDKALRLPPRPAAFLAALAQSLGTPVLTEAAAFAAAELRAGRHPAEAITPVGPLSQAECEIAIALLGPGAHMNLADAVNAALAATSPRPSRP